MPTPSKGPRLGGGPAHERLMLANLATALFEHGRITTTHAKARRLRPLAERLITSAKRGDLHARRRVLTVVRDKGVVHTLFADIGPRFAERPGGYTRITKIGPRKGDNAPMAVIELVESRTVAQQAVGEAERARGSRFRLPSRRPGAAAAGGTAAGSAVVSTGAAVDTTDAADVDATADVPDVPDVPGVAVDGADVDATAQAAGVEATDVPTEGDTDGSPEETGAPAPVPTEGDVDGDTVTTEATVREPAGRTDEVGDGPGEDATSAQTEAAGDQEPAEGADDDTTRGEPS